MDFPQDSGSIPMIVDFSKEFGKKLKKLTGQQLVVELRRVVSTIKQCEQRTRDRGCYLILESLGKVETQQAQEELIVDMLNANPEPSKGVRQQLAWWKPTSMPSVPAIVACISALGVSEFCERTLDMPSLRALERYARTGDEEDRIVPPSWPDDTFQAAKKALLEQKQYDQAALLAERFAPQELEALTDLVMQQAVQLREQELAYDTSKGWDHHAWQRAREGYVHLCVKLATTHRLKAPLVRLRSTDNLNRGEDVYYADKMSISVILNDKEWQQKALQDHLKMVEGVDVGSNLYRLSEQSFELVKQEEFAAYRQQLFSKIVTYKVERGDPWYVKILAEMAVHFNNAAWQEQVYKLTMKHLKGSYGHSVYEALGILAPVHQAAKQTLETTPRPEFVMVLR
jgi:hypothetical protein